MLGKTEVLILIAVDVAEARYCEGIRTAARKIWRTKVPTAAGVFITLQRLEKRGLVKSAFGPPEQRRGGRPKRIYGITRKGYGAIKATVAMWASILKHAPGGVEA